MHFGVSERRLAYIDGPTIEEVRISLVFLTYESTRSVRICVYVRR